ncbi:hypothetical protein M2405_006183 [Rhodococcus erythropolis]|uniref:hypothetical protein n=1 Tax=Rhodococcus erythropolis TaxID=1833 RepID=UPI0021695C7E|nr:hypothetical protein [Rhodococcus erythropolis]MCS4257856.1 hypothetical protein [Rhodococcus erythropolis]MCW2425161.1 hypothetical protein [Rhodococcus erythropolis]
MTAAERTELARLRKQVSEQEKDIAFLKRRPRTSRRTNKVDRYSLNAAEYANFAIHRMTRLLNV